MPIGLSVVDDSVAAVASISLALSSKSTDMDVARSTDIDLATDVSGPVSYTHLTLPTILRV